MIFKNFIHSYCIHEKYIYIYIGVCNLIIPIYINNFNWLTSTKAMVEYFQSISYVEPIIVDNASTYPPLLSWYETNPCKIIRLLNNCGHRAPWEQGCVLWAHTHKVIFGSNYYAVTDPDLDFTDVPKDLVYECIEGLKIFPEANKCGMALRIDDLPPNERTKKIIEWENHFWEHPINDRFFHADIDTTFAVYKCERLHSLAIKVGPSVRTNFPYVAKHLPWYYIGGNCELNDEQKYYFSTCDRSVNTYRPN